MTKQERNWLVWGSVGTVFLMITFVFLMSDWSPMYHPATSNTQALIDSLNALQSHPNEASSGGVVVLGGDNKSEPTGNNNSTPTDDDTTNDANQETSSNDSLKASDIDWDHTDTSTIDFENLNLDGSDVFTGDQILQLLENSEKQQPQ